jgi:hypothetical protein
MMPLQNTKYMPPESTYLSQEGLIIAFSIVLSFVSRHLCERDRGIPAAECEGPGADSVVFNLSMQLVDAAGLQDRPGRYVAADIALHPSSL